MKSLAGGLAGELEMTTRYDAIPWFVIQTRCCTETKVKMALECQGLKVFLPQAIVPRMRRGRKVMVNHPLFQGYLFVNTCVDFKVFHQIIRVNGVIRFLGNGTPDPVPVEQIESIRTIVASDRHYYPWRYLEKGKKIKVIDGPLAGVIGTLIGRHAKQSRLVVAVELFQRSVAVNLDQDAVEPWS